MYIELFLGLISDNRVEFQMLGIEDGGLGKMCGILTMVTTGCTVSSHYQHIYCSGLYNGGS